MTCPNEVTALRFVKGELDATTAREVELHVDRCEGCYATLTELARAFGSAVSLRGGITHESGLRHRSAEGGAPAAELAPGGRFGRYTVQDRLGQGGMGTVYLAFDSVLSRPVALKLMRPEAVPVGASHDIALGEARAIAQLSDPNVVAVYDAGVEAEQLYIAMEYVPGASFAAWLRAAARSKGEILRLLRQAGLGLVALHEAGLVHRDIKPDNVLVGADGRVRITDFGLARFGPGGDGVFVGTPAYMAPEQLFARPTDARGDQFAFALVVAEALTGTRPFAGRTVDELKWSLAQGRPLLQGVQRSLAAVLARALSVDPAARYRSMRELLHAIDDALDARHEVHFKLNVAFLIVMTVVHALVITFFMTRTNEPKPTTQHDPTLAFMDHAMADAFTPALGIFFIVFLITNLVWTPLGLLWAPVNAWGIATKKRWARISTIVYAASGLLTCVGTPYAAYALATLLRRDMKRAFDDADVKDPSGAL